jgi:hypothetical protein
MSAERHSEHSNSSDIIDELFWQIRIAEKSNSILLTHSPSVPDFIHCFVLQRLGIIDTDVQIFRSNTMINKALAKECFPLQNYNLMKAERLRSTIRNSDLPEQERRKLRQLVNYAEQYRGVKNKWITARNKIAANRSQLFLHDALTAILATNIDNSTSAQFDQILGFLTRLMLKPPENFLEPISFPLEVPIIKQDKDNEWTDAANVSFDAENILRVGYMNTIVIGGSPNSGKSTFTGSLVLALKDAIAQCETDGILPINKFNIDYCDMDKSSPTLEYLFKGEKPPKERFTPWSSEMISAAIEEYHDKLYGNNIVVVDLPGGIPDAITRALTERMGVDSLSIHIDRLTYAEATEWTEYMSEPGRPSYAVAIHTRMNEPDKKPGIRYFDSYSRFDKKNFIQARLCDLDRVLVPNDPVVKFIAHMLLFDFLPNLSDPEEELRYQVRESLNAKRKKKKNK